MPTMLTVVSDAANDGHAFDAMLKHPRLLRDTGEPLTVVLKNGATEGRNPIAMLCFTVEQKDGTMAVAQTVTTVACLKGALEVLEKLYPKGTAT